MAWNAVGELSALQERFREASVALHREHLRAEWTNFPRDSYSEGGLWLPSSSKPEVGIQGRVFLAGQKLSEPAVVNGMQASYSAALADVANEFRELARFGGRIITQLPQLKAELQRFVDGGGIGPEPDLGRWWLGLLFRDAGVSGHDYGVEAVELGKGLTYEAEVDEVYLASEAACEKLKALLERHGEACKWPSDDGWHFREGHAAFRGVAFEIQGVLWRLLKELAVKPGTPVRLAKLAECLGENTAPDSVRPQLTNTRNVLRKEFRIRIERDPLPNVERGRDAAWKLDEKVFPSISEIQRWLNGR